MKKTNIEMIIPLTPEKLMEEVLPVINAAVEAWRAKNTNETITARINKLLDDHSNTITMKLMGFNSSWGQDWSLDHCNGRAGESAAGDFIKQTQNAAIKAWLTEAMQNMPPMTTQVKNRFHRDAQTEYNEILRKAAYTYASEKADKDMTAMFASLASSSLFDKYIKTKKLLEATS